MKKPPLLPPPLPLSIHAYGSDGQGVSRLPDGMTCFVSGALRGETCLVQLDKVGKTCAWGHVQELLEPSPARQEPDCPHFPSCGGCALRHMTYPEELEFKRQKVSDCLTRIGGCQTPVSVIYGAKNTDRYRNKVQFPISGSSIGFYAAGTHAVTDVEDCLLQPQSSARLRRALKEYMALYQVPAYDERTGRGLLRHLYVRSNQAGESLCCLLCNGKSLPHEPQLVETLRQAEPSLKGIVLGVNERKTNVILGDSYRTLWGQDHLMDHMCSLSFRLSVPSFYQVNTPQAELLYGLALDYAALTGTETALDLYCGIGTITLCLARRARRAIGAEIVPQAIADAKANAQRNGIENTEFFCGDASQIAARLAQEGTRPHVITVDPPRKGLAGDVVSSIACMAPERVVYISCDPATLARDVHRFAQEGYLLQKAAAVDLFPRTPHVETVALLKK
ncbi:MAG: 23S rRNA (uracil(1939)-C(5))-methyltransferase RlmD [Oscillospiraceae bacterium]|nr:23S rRNA (uracil(1939)-C(5))-methyltransferase RlmD [Oscillospiraceae bacterium]